jgi:hypothetical protein
LSTCLNVASWSTYLLMFPSGMSRTMSWEISPFKATTTTCLGRRSHIERSLDRGASATSSHGCHPESTFHSFGPMHVLWSAHLFSNTRITSQTCQSRYFDGLGKHQCVSMQLSQSPQLMAQGLIWSKPSRC